MPQLRLAQHHSPASPASPAAGIYRTSMGRDERGERNIALDNVNALADALTVSPAYLVED